VASFSTVGTASFSSGVDRCCSQCGDEIAEQTYVPQVAGAVGGA
jgi:hypothetical protein